MRICELVTILFCYSIPFVSFLFCFDRNSTPTQDKAKDLEARCNRLEQELNLERRKTKDLERRLLLEKNRCEDLQQEVSQLRKENSSMRYVGLCNSMGRIILCNMAARYRVTLDKFSQ